MILAPGNDKKGLYEMNAENMRTGVVNCLRLHIHEKPDLTSDIICKLRYLTEVEVDLEESTDEFYKVYSAIGAEGFCEKYLITIR